MVVYLSGKMIPLNAQRVALCQDLALVTDHGRTQGLYYQIISNIWHHYPEVGCQIEDKRTKCSWEEKQLSNKWFRL